MFKISTKGDYGLLLLSALAERKGNCFASLKSIAAEKRLSVQYLSQIVLPLKEVGIVESKEGLGGGYRLAKDPKDITLIEILEALEGNVIPVRCCDKSEDGKRCGSEQYCGVKTIWHDASSLIRQFLKNKTLADTLRPHATNVEILTTTNH